MSSVYIVHRILSLCTVCCQIYAHTKQSTESNRFEKKWTYLCESNEIKLILPKLPSTSQTLLRPTCGLQTAQILILSITRSLLSCCLCVYHRQIHRVDELKRRLINVRCRGAVLNSRFLTRLLTGVEEDIERVSMLKKDISSTACELTMLILCISVIFNVTCHLCDCYIINCEIMPATLANSFLFILQGSAL